MFCDWSFIYELFANLHHTNVKSIINKNTAKSFDSKCEKNIHCRILIKSQFMMMSIVVKLISRHIKSQHYFMSDQMPRDHEYHIQHDTPIFKDERKQNYTSNSCYVNIWYRIHSRKHEEIDSHCKCKRKQIYRPFHFRFPSSRVIFDV
jgi:replication-associated recombination protein RarA